MVANIEENLFELVTSDLNQGIVKMKQEQFNNMRDDIDRVFIGTDSDFYSPEANNFIANLSSAKVEVKKSGG